MITMIFAERIHQMHEMWNMNRQNSTVADVDGPVDGMSWWTDEAQHQFNPEPTLGSIARHVRPRRVRPPVHPHIAQQNDVTFLPSNIIWSY